MWEIKTWRRGDGVIKCVSECLFLSLFQTGQSVFRSIPQEHGGCPQSEVRGHISMRL